MARRELLEEAGVGPGEAQRGLTELMEMRLVPVEEALRMAREGEISDGPGALALLLCPPLLDRNVPPDQ